VIKITRASFVPGTREIWGEYEYYHNDEKSEWKEIQVEELRTLK